MPYSNMPEALWGKMDECVQSVTEKRGLAKDRAIAICYTSLMGSKAVWTTAYMNDLPDSAFLYVEEGGEKDGEGKTTPRSLRHLPYKDAEGKIDIEHLRNAIQRTPQVKLVRTGKRIGPDKVRQLQERAREMLREAQKGGPDSGNWGHSGRPGHVGGSAPGGGHHTESWQNRQRERDGGGGRGRGNTEAAATGGGVSGLPRDLTTMNEAQQKRFLDYLVSLPTRELRRRQDLTSQQLGMASPRNTLAIGNLQTIERLLAAAVDIREFGDEPWPEDDEDEKGGKGSGNFGHAGRPGKRGGSAPGGGRGSTQPKIMGSAPGYRVEVPKGTRPGVDSDVWPNAPDRNEIFASGVPALWRYIGSNSENGDGLGNVLRGTDGNDFYAMTTGGAEGVFPVELVEVGDDNTVPEVFDPGGVMGRRPPAGVTSLTGLNWSPSGKSLDDKARGEGQGQGGPRQGDGGADVCVCTKCGYQMAHKAGTPCTEQKCPACGAKMAGADTPADNGSALNRLGQGIVSSTVSGLDSQVKTGFKIFQGTDGQDWLLTFTTNAFRDREDEIFTTKSIEDYVGRHENDPIKGEFQFWHLPGTAFGDIRWQATSGRFLVEAGTFRDTFVGQTFKEFFKRYPDGHPEIAPEGWGCSHKYYYDGSDRADGIYEWFDKTETTVLPYDVAANPHNPSPMFSLSGEKQREAEMNERQMQALKDIGGPDLLDAVISLGEKRTQELEGTVDFKQKGENDFASRFRAMMNESEDEDTKAAMNDMLPMVEKAAAAYGSEMDEEATAGMKATCDSLRKMAKQVGGEAGDRLTAMADEMEMGKKQDEEEDEKPPTPPKPPIPPKPEEKQEGEDDEEMEEEEEETESESKGLTPELVADAIGAVFSTVQDRLDGMQTEISNLTAEVKALKETDERKIAEKAQDVPQASLQAIIDRAIGSKAARVHGNSTLANDGPKETETPGPRITGISGIDDWIAQDSGRVPRPQ